MVTFGTAPLFMNVCFIFSDSSLHDWALETQLFFSTIVILSGLCYASQGSLGSGILWDPSPVSPIDFFFWLTDFGQLGLSFALWNLKHFPFMGLWTLILWIFSSFSSFFFLSLLQDSPMCYFPLGLGLWLILDLNI